MTAATVKLPLPTYDLSPQESVLITELLRARRATRWLRDTRGR